MHFTKASLKRLKPRTTQYDVRGEHGLGVRVNPAGTITWTYFYDFAGKRKRMRLGTWPAMGVKEAEKAHTAARARVARGLDPAGEVRRTRQETAAAPTVDGLVSEYLDRWARPRKRSWREDERILTGEVHRAWGTRRAQEIARRDVIALVDGIRDRGAPIQANRTLAVVRKMFNFAVSRDLLPASPCTQVKAPAVEHRRDRVLSDEEVRAFWTGLDSARVAKVTALALRFQLTTAQRVGEVIGASWAEIDLDAGWWTIPAERSKNKLAHRVPLSRLAVEILAQARWLGAGSPWVFRSPTGKDHLTLAAISQAMRKNRDALGIAHATPHDLRRTAASQMTGAGVPRLVVSKILNHAEPGVTAVYDRHSYDREKREALDKWADQLRRVLGGERKSIVSRQHPSKP
jgi:integrase